MESALRALHAWFALAGAAIASAVLATGASRTWRLAGRALAAALAFELATGALLYLVYSPFTAGVRANVDVVLRDPTLRHWNVVHPVLGGLTAAATWRAWKSATPARLAMAAFAFAATTALSLWFS